MVIPYTINKKMNRLVSLLGIRKIYNNGPNIQTVDEKRDYFPYKYFKFDNGNNDIKLMPHHAVYYNKVEFVNMLQMYMDDCRKSF